MSANYTHPEDLLSDESFLTWYFKRGKGDAIPRGKTTQGEVISQAEAISWDEWMAGNADRAQLVQQAILLLDQTVIPESPLPSGQLETAEKALFARLDAAPAARSTSLYKYGRWMVAASILLALGIGLWLTAGNKADNTLEIKTAYGQQSRQQLPDGTIVTLNANSRISYNKGWTAGADREVWVDGEAFFHVTHTPENSKFIVHTAHIYIVVTGTQFNVINRPGAENVLLKEGKVIVGSRKENEKTLAPGDFVAWKQDVLENRVVQADSLMAWQEHRLVFSQTPLKDLAAILGNQYGVRVELENLSIADSAISGMLPNNDLDVLIKALNATSEYEAIRKDDLITIRSHPVQK